MCKTRMKKKIRHDDYARNKKKKFLKIMGFQQKRRETLSTEKFLTWTKLSFVYIERTICVQRTRFNQ